MENRAAKRRQKGDADDDEVGSDRISQLPDSVLLHMLCFLSQKKAVQTSVLSKSWRHLGPARPVIDLRRNCDLHCSAAVCENCFDGNNEAFISALDKTFQRYHDQNLFTQEIDLQMFCRNSQSISVLEKWIPIFINPDKPGVTKFRLSLNTTCFNIPSVALKAESLQELDLFMCRIGSIDDVMLKNLQKLSLSRVHVSDEALEKIIAGCPLVKCVDLYQCEGLKTINIGNKNHHHLNNFEHFSFKGVNSEISIEIDAPNLQSISVVRCWDWHRTHNNYFPNLKSLFLVGVKLPNESFVDFSSNFPRLEELKLEHCCGFEDIKLSSCSIKRLIIHVWRPINKVALEVPNILYFEFFDSYLPTTFSLTTTSTDWKSNLNLFHCVYYDGDDVLPRILQLFEMVKALSQSQISLTLSENFYLKKMKKIKWNFNDHPAVVVEHLSLDIGKLCPYLHTHFLNVLLRIFRPRYTNAVSGNQKDDEELIECLQKTLMHKRKKTKYGWEQYLEEVSIEASDRNGIIWHHVQWARLPEWSKNRKIRFLLKWRDLVDY